MTSRPTGVNWGSVNAENEHERHRDGLAATRPAQLASTLRARIQELRTEAHRAVDSQFDDRVTGEPIPRPVKLAAGWVVRLTLIGFGILALLWLLDVLAVVIIPLVVSLLIAALLTPMTRALRRTGMPNGLATLISFVVGVAAVGGLITLIVREFVANYQTVYDTVREGLQRGAHWLSEGPLQIDEATLQEGIDSTLAKFQQDPAEIVGTSLTVVSTTGSILSGILLSLFIIFFFLLDGAAMWAWLCRLFPRTARWKVHRAGKRCWEVLVAYMNVTLLVALIVGASTWLACGIAGVPLALSAGLIAFLFAFIPTLGGLISSIVVVILALISTSLTTAVVMAVVMIGIQTIQGNFIYPILMNRQLKVHPLASLLLVVLGAVVGGIFGALIAVPLAAMINTAWLDLLRSSRGLPESDRASSLGPSDDTEELLRDPTLDDPTDDDNTPNIDTFGPGHDKEQPAAKDAVRRVTGPAES